MAAGSRPGHRGRVFQIPTAVTGHADAEPRIVMAAPAGGLAEPEDHPRWAVVKSSLSTSPGLL